MVAVTLSSSMSTQFLSQLAGHLRPRRVTIKMKNKINLIDSTIPHLFRADVSYYSLA